MHVTLIRHAPTHVKHCLGWRDVCADVSDIRAFEQLNKNLPHNATLMSSDLKRAVQTAQKIQHQQDVLVSDAGLREFNFGDWDGMSFDEISARDPVLSRDFWDRAGDICAPNGESWNMVLERSTRALSQACEAAKTPHLLVVTHLGVILTQIARAKQITPYEAMSHSVTYLSATKFTLSNNKWLIDNQTLSP